MTEKNVSPSAEEEHRAQARLRLYEEQMALLKTFLANGAISQAQYDKSAGDLTEKMGFGEKKTEGSPCDLPHGEKK